MITLQQYVGVHQSSPDWTNDRKENSVDLLEKVNKLLDTFPDTPINPSTGSQVSGQTFGGFRPQSCPQGAPNSSHKQGQGVDVYDPNNELDDVIDDDVLSEFNLYREHPDSTPGWCHLTTRSPKSGNRTFLP